MTPQFQIGTRVEWHRNAGTPASRHYNPGAGTVVRVSDKRISIRFDSPRFPHVLHYKAGELRIIQPVEVVA